MRCHASDTTDTYLSGGDMKNYGYEILCVAYCATMLYTAVLMMVM